MAGGITKSANEFSGRLWGPGGGSKLSGSEPPSVGRQ